MKLGYWQEAVKDRVNRVDICVAESHSMMNVKAAECATQLSPEDHKAPNESKPFEIFACK